MVSARVREHVRFLRLNLFKDVLPSGCDVIFCRNVLYYFSPTAQVDVLKKFWKSLRTDGFLFIGSSEPYNRLESYFRVVGIDERVLQAWKTDRRIPDRRSGMTFADIAAPGSTTPEDSTFVERRVERPESPGGVIVGQGERLMLTGVISSAGDFQSFQRALTFEMSNLEKKAWIDGRELSWISNDALHDLRIVLEEAVRRRRVRIQGAIFATESVASWFAQAGFGSLVGRLDVEGAERKEFSLAQPVPRAPEVERLGPARTVAASQVVGTDMPPRKDRHFHDVSAAGEARIVAFPEIADKSCLEELRRALANALSGGLAFSMSGADPTEVILELSRCRLIEDSVAIVVDRAARSRRDGQRIVLRGASPAVARLLTRFLPRDSDIVWHGNR